MSTPTANIQKQDLTLLRQAMHRERRTLFPAVPKSRKQVMKAVSDMGVRTNRDEKFLLASDEPNSIVLFGCLTNLNFLCESTEEICC